MNMMRRLLSSVNNVWNTQATEQAIFTVRQGTGQHALMTIDNGQIHFHSNPYHTTLPVKQSIILEDLTLGELIPVMTGMGYIVEVLPGREHYLTEGAVLLMYCQNMPISSGFMCHIFTSNVWRMLYPLARLLELVEGDVDLAMQQMFLRSSKRKWLDYWASFFAVRRYIGESDLALVRRIVLFLVNPKTNNRSMEELIKIGTGVEVIIEDVAPAIFNVTIVGEDTTKIEDIDKLLRRIKAGGVYYYFNSSEDLEYTEEDFASYLRDATGKPFRELDGIIPLMFIDMFYQEARRMRDSMMDTRSSEVQLFETVIRDKMQEEVLPFNSDINGSEDMRTHRRVREGEGLPNTVELIEQKFGALAFREVNGFTLNVSVFGGEDLLMPITNITTKLADNLQMTMTNARGQVIQTYN